MDMESVAEVAVIVMAEIDQGLRERGITAMWELRHYESGRMFVEIYGPQGTRGAININQFNEWLERQPERMVEDGSSS